MSPLNRNRVEGPTPPYGGDWNSVTKNAQNLKDSARRVWCHLLTTGASIVYRVRSIGYMVYSLSL